MAHCSFCGIELNDGDPAYGLTGGVISDACDGFRMDDNDDWDLYCANCMNVIDKLVATHKAAENSHEMD